MSNTKSPVRKRPTASQCKESIIARYEALKLALKDPGDAPRALVVACRTSAAFQQLELPSHGITRLGSRNTAVKYANIVLADVASERSKSGWELMDELRKTVDRKLSPLKCRRSVAEKNRRLQARIAELENKLDQSERLMLAQSRAYFWLLQGIRGLAGSRNMDTMTREKIGLLLRSNSDTFSHLFGPDTPAQPGGGQIVGISQS